ncbi:hypothetical protein ES703_123851 [subsurface metagenome]
MFHQSFFFQPFKSAYKTHLFFELVRIVVAVMELHVVEIPETCPFQSLLYKYVMFFLFDAACIMISAYPVHCYLAVVSFAVLKDRIRHSAPQPPVSLMPVVQPA